ncbi:MAG: NAD(P)H-hydrate epimerase [Phycisphaeraceae bacterium]|nr:NAD(P)H-hydrate epimerase [Phycisphaeraceae bacterium]
MNHATPAGFETLPRGAPHALPVVSCAQARAIDKAAAARLGVPTLLLMENAARHAAHLALELRRAGGRVVCVCGRGNNGGDGIAAARLLESAGVPCEIVLPEEPDPASDAGANLAIARRLDMGVCSAPPASIDGVGLIIDAVLGTGVRQPPRGAAQGMIAWINRAGVPVLSLDLPSGLDADTGEPVGAEAVGASATVSFVGMKRGLLTDQGRRHGGRLYAADIGLPPGFVNRVLRETTA